MITKEPLLGSEAPIFNPSSQEAGAGWSMYQGHSGLHNEALSPKTSTLIHSWWEREVGQPLQKLASSFLKCYKQPTMWPSYIKFTWKTSHLPLSDSTTVCPATLATAKVWNQHRSPSIGEWSKSRWHLYNGQYFSSSQRNGWRTD